LASKSRRPANRGLAGDVAMPTPPRRPHACIAAALLHVLEPALETLRRHHPVCRPRFRRRRFRLHRRHAKTNQLSTISPFEARRLISQITQPCDFSLRWNEKVQKSPIAYQLIPQYLRTVVDAKSTPRLPAKQIVDTRYELGGRAV